MSVRSLVKLVAFLTVIIAFGCEGRLSGVSSQDENLRGENVGGPNNREGGNEATPNAPGVSDGNAHLSLHRLNRLEYNNAINELLNTDLDPASDFPPDVSINGFDNVAHAHNLSPTLFDAYSNAARSVVEHAMSIRPEHSDSLDVDTFNFDAPGELQRVGEFVRLRGAGAQVSFIVPAAGMYQLAVGLGGVRIGTAAAPSVQIRVDGQLVESPTLSNSTISEPRRYDLQLAAGGHELTLTPTNYINDAAVNVANDVLIKNLAVTSHMMSRGPGRTLFTCILATPGCGSSILEQFAYRAWRRPLTPDERSSISELYDDLLEAGEEDEDAVKLGMRAILTSSKFIYRYRSLSDTDTSDVLDPYVLASRLSFFIWSSIPDARLLDAAENGELATEDGVAETINWMIADRRAVALADGFAEQWLDLRNLENASPSAEVFPEFNEQVRQAMITESKLFWLDYLENDAPIASMLTPDFTYTNGVLQSHYNEAGSGSDFMRVDAAEGDRRGILALGAWLTSRSDSEHASPIRRGSWLSDNVLCTPVQPPPPGLEIGELPEGGELSVREQLEEHRADPACRSCHSALDIIGMGFQVYDGVGRFQEDPSLDSDGEIPGTGAIFYGSDGLAQEMDRDQFVSCVAEKLTTYALGRPLRSSDREWVQALEKDGLTLPQLITRIAQSDAFKKPTPLDTQEAPQ